MFSYADFEDGWDPQPALDGRAVQSRTIVRQERPKTILARNDSPDVPFDRSLNPYQGCEHGCVYCFARPTHAYWGLSAGLDFETQLFSKPDAAHMLRKELARPGYRPAPLGLGTNTDPWQPIERQLGITRSVLEVLVETKHPASIVTKSRGLLRDLDLLGALARDSLVHVCVSVTTLDRALSRSMEPRAASPEGRIEMIGALAGAGVPVGVLVAPVIPAVNDAELESILEAVAEAGGRSAGYVLLRLPGEVEGLFRDWLGERFPNRKERVMGLLSAAHEGRPYRATWGIRQRGSGPWAELLARRFEIAVRRLGLDGKLPPLDVSAFRPPGERQLGLFG